MHGGDAPGEHTGGAVRASGDAPPRRGARPASRRRLAAGPVLVSLAHLVGCLASLLGEDNVDLRWRFVKRHHARAICTRHAPCSRSSKSRTIEHLPALEILSIQAFFGIFCFTIIKKFYECEWFWTPDESRLVCFR